MKNPRTEGVEPGRRRLQLGLSAVVGREDGAVVEIFPDGTETVLVAPGADGSPTARTRKRTAMRPSP